MAWGMTHLVFNLFGSSIMEGRIGVERAADRWYNLLQASLSEHFPGICFPCFNAAVGGESTRECMARFDRDVLACHPDYCLVMIGGNNHDCTRPQRILAEGELERLMADFADRLPACTTPVGVVINPVIDDWHFATRHPAYQDYLREQGGLNAAIEQERNLFRRFLRERHWPFLDLCDAFAPDPRRYILPTDGIHLNPEGHRRFAEQAFDLLVPLIEARS